MTPMEPSVPARRNLPMTAAIILAALLALGMVFILPG